MFGNGVQRPCTYVRTYMHIGVHSRKFYSYLSQNRSFEWGWCHGSLVLLLCSSHSEVALLSACVLSHCHLERERCVATLLPQLTSTTCIHRNQVCFITLDSVFGVTMHKLLTPYNSAHSPATEYLHTIATPLSGPTVSGSVLATQNC